MAAELSGSMPQLKVLQLEFSKPFTEVCVLMKAVAVVPVLASVVGMRLITILDWRAPKEAPVVSEHFLQ
jgi:hypothetical protein